METSRSAWRYETRVELDIMRWAKSRARPLVEATSLLEVIKNRCDSAKNPEWMSPGLVT